MAKEVRKYPCLYDRASQHYKDKRKVADVWKRVDEQRGFEEGNTSKKLSFTVLCLFIGRKNMNNNLRAVNFISIIYLFYFRVFQNYL